MKEIYIKDIEKYLGKDIELYGWIHTKRVHGKITFVIVRDKTGNIQCTFKEDILGEKYKEILEVLDESTIKVVGTVKEKPKGGYEILVKDFEILNKSERLPIEIWNPDVKTSFINRIKYRFLDLRKDEIRKIFEIRSKVVNLMREFLLKEGFIEMHTPKIVLMGVESGSDVFEINYFDKKAYLTQSPQLYKQMLMASGIDKYFEISPYWRAEKSHTSRHLTEFWGLDAEVAWIFDYNKILDLLEKMINYIIKNVKDDLKSLNIEIDEPGKIPRIKIREVYEILRSYNFEIKDGDDLNSEAEKLVGEIVKKEYDSDFVFITEYPWMHRPFYTMRKDDDPDYTYSYDCLFKGLEILSGAKREHRYEKLIQNIREKGIESNSLYYYLESFRYGMPPHAGFGLGIDRFVKQLLNLNDIRESILWFRDPEHLLP